MKLKVSAALIAACVLTTAVCADEANLLASYGSADWQGDSLALDNASGAIYFSGDGSEQSAALEIAVEGTGIYFCVDAGNGVNTGDSGYCTLEFCGNEGEVLSSVSTGNIKGLDNYTRFYIGSEGSYYPLPEGTEKVIITLHAAIAGNSGKAKVYFRNFMLFCSSEKPLAQELTYMKSIAGLTKVEVGLNPWLRWIWVGAVLAVAMVFFLVRKMREKYKSPEIMKAGKRKR